MLMRQILNRPRTHESTCPELARQPLRGVAIGLAGKPAGWAGRGGVEFFDDSLGRDPCFGPEQRLQQHSSGEAAEELLRKGKGGGERGWLERDAAQDRDDAGNSFSPHTPSKKITRGLHEKQAFWRSGRLRAGSKQICLRRLFQPALEEQNDDAPLSELYEDPVFLARAGGGANDDDRGATGGGYGPSPVRVDGPRPQGSVEPRDVEPALFTIRRNFFGPFPHRGHAAGRQKRDEKSRRKSFAFHSSKRDRWRGEGFSGGASAAGTVFFTFKESSLFSSFSRSHSRCPLSMK